MSISSTKKRLLASPQPDVIHIVDDNLRDGFAQIPRPVLKAHGLSIKAKAIYIALLDYAWQSGSCYPGQPLLAEDLGISVDTVQRGLNELRAYGLVSWKRQGLNRPNIYFLERLSDNPNLTLSQSGNRTLRQPDTAPVRHQETAPVRHKQYTEKQYSQQQMVVGGGNDEKKPAIASNSAVDELVRSLVRFGLTMATAERLTRSYSGPHLGKHLDMHAFRLAADQRMRNPAGLLRLAIEEDWAPPAGYVSPMEKAATERRRTEQRKAAERKEEEERRRQRTAALKVQKAVKSVFQTRYPTIPISGSRHTTHSAWKVAKARLRSLLSSAEFNGFLSLSVLARVVDGVAELIVANDFAATFLRTRRLPVIQEALTEVLGHPVRLTIAGVRPTPADTAAEQQSSSRTFPTRAVTAPRRTGRLGET